MKTNQNKLKGILFILLAAVSFSLMAFFVRLAGDLPALQKALFRNVIAAFVAAGMLKRSGEKLVIGKQNILPMLGRCLFGTFGIVGNFWAIGHMALADASMLQKISPFITVLTSALILREKPARRDLVYVLIAFVGVVFVVKPGFGVTTLPALVALLGGIGAGTAYTFVRRLGLNGVKGPVIIFCFSVFSSLFLLPFVIAGYHPMTTRQVLCLLGAGVAASVGQIGVTTAYTYAPAKEISVFEYTQIIFAALLSILFLSEIPDVYSVTGYVIIIGTAVARWQHTLRADQKKDASLIHACRII